MSGRKRARKTSGRASKKIKPGTLFLHSADCTGRPSDVALLQRKLEKYPNWLEIKQGPHWPHLISPLMDAVLKKHEDCVRFLLNANADPDTIGPDGNPALYHTVFSPDDKIAVSETLFRLLLNAGADVNALCAGEEGRFPLFALLCLSRNPDMKTIELCFDYGANPNGTGFSRLNNRMGFVELIIMRSTCEALKFFLAKGADPNIVVTDGYVAPHLPPLCASIIMGKLDFTKVLIMFGANMNLAELHAWFRTTSIVDTIFFSGNDFKVRTKMLELFYKCGYNIRTHRDYIPVNDETTRFLREVDKLCHEPLTLLELSRISLLKTLGKHYTSTVFNSRELPHTLYPFLQFADVTL